MRDHIFYRAPILLGRINECLNTQTFFSPGTESLNLRQNTGREQLLRV